MEILKPINNLSILLNPTQDFKNDAGWQENMQELDQDVLGKIINPIENYETVRYIHKPYMSINNVYQSDIWFYFYFYDGSTFTQNYELIGITSDENWKITSQITNSFFRLDFYKTPNNENPTRANRRLVMTRDLSVPLGEKFFYTTIGKSIYLPVFTGSNIKNKENMYLFWFQDETVFNETLLTGDTFWMTARFYNSNDGTILDFNNSGITVGNILESRDQYFKVLIDKTDYSYQVYKFNGSVGSRVGTPDTPIEFYQRLDSIPPSPTPSISQSTTPTPTPSITNSATPTVTPTNTKTPTQTPTNTPTPTRTLPPRVGKLIAQSINGAAYATDLCFQFPTYGLINPLSIKTVYFEAGATVTPGNSYNVYKTGNLNDFTIFNGATESPIGATTWAIIQAGSQFNYTVNISSSGVLNNWTSC